MARPKTVLEIKANSLYDNHLERDEKFMREEISSKNYIIKTLLENIYQINSSFYKHAYNQNIKQNVNAEIRDDFVFQKSQKNKPFNTANRLKALKQLVWGLLVMWKNALNWKTCSISMFSEILSPHKNVLAPLFKK